MPPTTPRRGRTAAATGNAPASTPPTATDQPAAPRKRPGPRRALTERAIFDAALRLVDTGGADALSVRAVAAALDVAPNALYTYFPTKAELARALVDDLLARLDLDTGSPSADWRTTITGLALDLRSLLLRHPGIVSLLLRSSFDGPHALAAGETLLELLTNAGLTDDDAARASYLLMTYILGTVALDVAELPPGQRRPDDTTRTRHRREALTPLPADHYPRTAAATDVVAAYNSTQQYRWGLDRLLDAITITESPGRKK